MGGRAGKRESTVTSVDRKKLSQVLERVKKNNVRKSKPSVKNPITRKKKTVTKKQSEKMETDTEDEEEPPVLTKSVTETLVVEKDAEEGASPETVGVEMLCDIEQVPPSPVQVDLVSDDSVEVPLKLGFPPEDKMDVDKGTGETKKDNKMDADKRQQLESLQKAVQEELEKELGTDTGKIVKRDSKVTEAKSRPGQLNEEVVPVEKSKNVALEDLLAPNKLTLRKLPTSRAVESKNSVQSSDSSPVKVRSASVESTKTATPDIMLVAGTERKPSCVSLLLEHSEYFRRVLGSAPKKPSGMLKHEVDLPDPNVLGLLVRKIKQSKITVTYDEALQLLQPAIKLEMDILKDECLQTFMGKISGENWLKLKFLAIEANCADLNRMLDQNMEASSSTILPFVLKSTQFLNMPLADLGKLLWKKNFNVAEVTVIKITEAWLNHEKRGDNLSIYVQVKSFELLRHEETSSLGIFDGKPTPLPTLEMDTPGWIFLQSLITPKKLIAEFKAYDLSLSGCSVAKTKLIDPQVTIPMEEKVKNRKRLLNVDDIGNAKRRNVGVSHQEISSLPRIPKKESSKSSVGDESKSWDPLGSNSLSGDIQSRKNGYGEDRRTDSGNVRGARGNVGDGRGRGSRISGGRPSVNMDSDWDNAGTSSIPKEDDSWETQSNRGGLQPKVENWDCEDSASSQWGRSFDNSDKPSRGGFNGRGRGRTDGNRSDGGNTDSPWGRKANAWGGPKTDSKCASPAKMDVDDWGCSDSKKVAATSDSDWGAPPPSNFKGESRSRNNSFNRSQNEGGSSPWGGSGNNNGGSSWGNSGDKDGGSSWGKSGDKDGGSSWGKSGDKDGGSSWGKSGDNDSASSWGKSGDKDGGSSWGGKDSGWGRKDSGSAWGSDSSTNNDSGWGNRRDSGSSFGDRGRGGRGRGGDRGGRGGGRGGRREAQPGDWACDQCNFSTNFAFKQQCFKCDAPRPPGAGNGSGRGGRGGGRGSGYSRGGGFNNRSNDGGGWGGSDSWGGGSSNTTAKADDDDWDTPAPATAKAAAPPATAAADDDWDTPAPATTKPQAPAAAAASADDEWDTPAPVTAKAPTPRVADDWGTPAPATAKASAHRVADDWGTPAPATAKAPAPRVADDWDTPAPATAKAPVPRVADDWDTPALATAKAPAPRVADNWDTPSSATAKIPASASDERDTSTPVTAKVPTHTAAVASDINEKHSPATVTATAADGEWDDGALSTKASTANNPTEVVKVEGDGEWNRVPEVNKTAPAVASEALKTGRVDVDSQVERNTVRDVVFSPGATNSAKSIENELERGNFHQKPPQETSEIPNPVNIPPCVLTTSVQHQQVHQLTQELPLADPRLLRRTSREPKLPEARQVIIMGTEFAPTQPETMQPWVVSRIDGIVAPTVREYELPFTEAVMTEEEPVKIPMDVALPGAVNDPRQHRAGLAISGMVNGTAEQKIAEVSDRVEVDNVLIVPTVSSQIQIPAAPASVVAASEDDGWD